MTKKAHCVLAYDLGGTKVAVGVVNEKGKILNSVRVPALVDQGKEAVIRQLGDLGLELLQEYPKIKQVGIASAGPLDPYKGVLLDPTNFVSYAGTWGKVPLVKILEKRLKKTVILENDAAAAILAEHWVGAARKFNNAMILTLGTGLGTGVICNGELVRAGRRLHTEAGHLILKHGDATAPCGCGNLGCAEAYLSGRSFSHRANANWLQRSRNFSAKEIAELARAKDLEALSAFEEYAKMMAVAIHNFVVIYAPEIVIFTGSFAEASDLFIESTRTHLENLLARRRIGTDMLPKLMVSKLGNNAGLIGGAYVALFDR